LNLADLNEKSHANLTNKLTSDHHVKTVASELNLADLGEKSYNSLTDKPTIVFTGVGMASDTIVHANDAERSTPDTLQSKLKEVKVYVAIKNCRVEFQMKTEITDKQVIGSVRVNDIIIGEAFNTVSDSYVVFNRDVSNVNSGDLIQIWGGRGGQATTCYVNNMKIKFDEVYVDSDP